MSDSTLMPPVGPEHDGLRETFLVGLPSELREHLRGVSQGVYRFAATYGLLYCDPDLEQEAAEMVGLWRELAYLKDLAGHYERRAQGEGRQGVCLIRVCLEEAFAQAKPLLPEGIS